jgi:hypothetical protein
MGDEDNGQGKSRLDRMEEQMEILKASHIEFDREYKRLLKILYRDDPPSPPQQQ